MRLSGRSGAPIAALSQATKVVVGTVAAVNKAAAQEQGFGGGLH
jgi:hypothetical protein